MIKNSTDDFLDKLRNEFKDYDILASVRFGHVRGLIYVDYDNLEKTLDYLDESVFNPELVYVEYEIDHDLKRIAIGGW